MPEQAIPVLIDDRLATCRYAHPVSNGWSQVDAVTTVPRLGPAQVRESNAIALVDSLAASRLLDTHVIVSDHAVASSRASFLTLVTHIRPDDVDNVTVASPGVSFSGRGLAETTLPRFYGITVTGWSNEPLPLRDDTSILNEDAEALIPLEDPDAFQEDLGRAWFLLTDTPYVSHICVAPRSELSRDPEAVKAAVGKLEDLKALSTDRARELRRNLSADLGIDRDLLADTLADQTNHLGDAERAGLLGLWRATGVELPANTQGLFVKLS